MPTRLVIFCVVAGLLFGLNTSFAQAQDSTTYYFSGVFEKTILPSGEEEITKYYPLIGGTTAVRKNDQLYFLHQDHLSSTRLMTDKNGQKNMAINYYPYGLTASTAIMTTTSGPARLTDRLYTSQILDDSTGVYFYNARQYNPTTGVFISADSAQGSNRYAYVGGNPISRNDPSGEVAIGGATGDEAGGGQNPWGVPWSSTAGWGGKISPTSLEDEARIGESIRFLGYNVLSGAGLYPFLAGAEAITGRDFVSGEKIPKVSRVIRALGGAIGVGLDYFLGPIGYGNAPSALVEEYKWGHSLGYYKQMAAETGATGVSRSEGTRAHPHVGAYGSRGPDWGTSLSDMEYYLGGNPTSAAHEYNHLLKAQELTGIYGEPSVERMGSGFVRLEELAADSAAMHTALIQGDYYGWLNSLLHSTQWALGGSSMMAQTLTVASGAGAGLFGFATGYTIGYTYTMD